ncbi:lipase 1-like [Hermetia illucens]|uniref:lipase 1-like n=1 Tax=Hermetia illucens TaxID=343691 RepID=UPI0018CC6828|nr:lipase 1-like [Hermetia illucens]
MLKYFVVTFTLLFACKAAVDKDVAEDALLTTPQLIKKYGYPDETHQVETEDGYILEVHRIARPGAQPIYLQHGNLDSSGTWVLMGPNLGLGYYLWELGYDIWMGNNRGNRYSKKHKTLSPSDSSFWDFSWHEIGINDLPATIDYILGHTGFEKLHYIGHSQGTTSFFVMASERPEYNDKIISMQALAPVASFIDIKSPYILYIATWLEAVDYWSTMFGVNEFSANDEVKSQSKILLCNDDSLYQLACANDLFLIGGFDQAQLNYTMLPVINGHTPAGASVKQMLHYGQLARYKNFCQYDYGWYLNFFQYFSYFPPCYDLKKITAPVILHHATNDWLAPSYDVNQLFEDLGNPRGKYLVPYPEFNHFDFIWGIDSRVLVHNKIVSVLKELEQEEKSKN